MTFFKIEATERRSLRYRLVLAFSLMSIIPLLILGYIITSFIFPDAKYTAEISAILLFAVWISWLGYLFIRQIITPILDLALETRIISEGKFSPKFSMTKEDELGDIAAAVNTMTGKIRSYIAELQDYSKKTASLNMRIHKKVITLTNLMRLGDLISTGAGYDEITAFAAEKISGEMEKAFCVIYSREQNGAYVMKSFYNASRKDIPVEDISREIQLVDKLFSKNECLLMDSRPLTAQWQRDLRDKLGIKNVLIYPMKDNTRLLGAIVTGGSYDEIRFDDEEIGVLRAYAKELVLAHQSSQVFERVKSLDVVDSLTGLYTRAYLEDRLEDEINRAVFYQRPCSILVMNIDDFEKYAEREGVQKSKKLLKQLAQFLTAMSMPVGKVARFDYDEFGILLPERNKRESIEIAEDIRRRVSSMDISADPADGITVSIGVGENPIDGTNAKEIIAKAYRNMQRAKESGKNRVVGE